jgi:hypothetical protein
VLFGPNSFPEQPSLRYRCRNRHLCGGCKLPEPAERAIDAFCCRGCYTGFFRNRCRVCERPFERRNERQQICDRRKCRNAFRANRASFFSSRYPEPTDVIRDPETSIKQGVKTACAWVVVARPAVSEENLQPPDSETAGRMARAGAEFQKWRRQAEAAEVEAAGEFSDPEWREVVSPDGVRCFATSARRAIESATAPSRCAPSDPVTTTAAAALIKTIPDDLSIPAFLKRGPAKS